MDNVPPIKFWFYGKSFHCLDLVICLDFAGKWAAYEFSWKVFVINFV